MARTTGKAELRRDLESVGLPQRELARLLGTNPSTVNRWVTGRGRDDALPVPQYVRAFVAAYAELTPAQREGVRALLV